MIATIRPAHKLEGAITVPGDKSISHRALMFGALATGRTAIAGLLEGEDVLNTAKALQAMGCPVRKVGATWEVLGRGVGGLGEPEADIDCGNSGTGLRLMMGLVAGHDMRVRFVGDASLSRRPMGRVFRPLIQMGLEVEEKGKDTLPLTLRGTADLLPIEYAPPVPSAQIKSAVLLAGLHAAGATTVVEAQATRDHTERMLRHFGAEVAVARRSDGSLAITVAGDAELEGRSVNVPGDPSSTAFLTAAALIVPGSEITIEGVLVNPTRTGFYVTLAEMGADVAFRNEREEGGEPVADIQVRHSRLNGVRVPPERAPSMIDEYPVLACLAAYAVGETRMEGLAELKVKESDRRGADRRRRQGRARGRHGRHPSRPPHRHGLPDAGPRRRPARHHRRRRHHRHQLPGVPLADGAVGRDLRRARGGALMSVALHRSPSPRLPSGPPHARPVPVQPEGSRGEGWGEGQKIAPLGCTWLPLTLALSPCRKRHGERGQVESGARP